MMKIEQLIKEILSKGISVVGITLYDDEFCYEIDGFYKSGSVKLYVLDGDIKAMARYNEVTDITCFEDLVTLNYQWWDYSKDRYEGWATPHPAWEPYLLELGLITKEVETKITYK